MTGPSGYPPEPWYLGGSLLVSVFAVPADDLPRGLVLPQGRRALRLGSRVIVGVAAVQYVPGGALEYDELLVAVPSLGRGGLRVTIPQIWVDSPVSLRGGRELWGIPKQLARFIRRTTPNGRTLVRVTGDPADGGSTDGGIAAVQARRGRPLLPGLRQVVLPILQQLDRRVTLSHNLVIGRISGLRATWRFDRDGALGWLHGRRPVLSVELHDAAVVFGMDVTRSATATAAEGAPATPATPTGPATPRETRLP
ncbi:acetoacetate decarboxylase family protein [Herbiconiux liangxiaofengii]|uniref:acetoacetate decarboxylase family protein n=1 Tax=Herbiconiux liangxiaofengii TaxID=3342795 RepID=UPI0035BB7B93